MKDTNDKRQISVKKFTYAFLLTTLVFILGLMLGSNLSEKKLGIAMNIVDDLKTNMADIELVNYMFGEDPCNNEQILNKLTDMLGREESKITYLENEIGRRNKKVIKVKRDYTTLLLRHYLLVKKLKHMCNVNYSIILFFYSNEDKYIDKCKKQGYILDYIRKQDNNVRLYAIDVDLELESVNILKERYNITSVPNLVINGKRYDEFVNKTRLLDIINGER